VRRPLEQGDAVKANKVESGDITPTPSLAQALSADSAEYRNALLARAVLEVGAAPSASYAWWLYRDPTSGLLAIRVLYCPEESAHFPATRGCA
jgi:hypothetical protein